MRAQAPAKSAPALASCQILRQSTGPLYGAKRADHPGSFTIALPIGESPTLMTSSSEVKTKGFV